MRALPSNWYTSREMYELERRAIFSRKWQLITHKARLPNAGDWLQFEVAQFKVVLCKDREGKIDQAQHRFGRQRLAVGPHEPKGGAVLSALRRGQSSAPSGPSLS